LITAAQTSEIIKEHQKRDGDTGSSEVQIALLTTRIRQLTEHLAKHKKDHHSRRGLLLLVSQRKALQGYLKRKDKSGYASLIEKLGIRG